MIEAHNDKRRQQYINNAIRTWTNKKQGNYCWHEIERHTPAYCDIQIEYFKRLLNP
jgi:hypothetical protein